LDEPYAEEMVLPTPLSSEKYVVCIFGAEREGQLPHIHVIIPGELNVAYCIWDDAILGVIEGDNAVLKSLTKEVVEWFELPNKYFGTNRLACFYQYGIQNSMKPLIHKPH
jgi:hypothetical protein